MRRTSFIASIAISSLLLLTTTTLLAQQVQNKIPAEANQLQNPMKENLSATSRGAKLYKKVCLICHGTTGKGDGSQAAEINTKPADFNHETIISRTDGALFWWISNGGNDMQPFKEVLPPNDIWSLVNYVRTLQPTTNQ